MPKFWKTFCPINVTITLSYVPFLQLPKKKIKNTSNLRGIDTFANILSDFQNHNI